MSFIPTHVWFLRTPKAVCWFAGVFLSLAMVLCSSCTSLFHFWRLLCVCEVLTDVAVSSDTTQTGASCGNVRHRGFQATPLLQHTFFQSHQAWYCVLFVVFTLHHALNLLHSYSLKSAYCREEKAEAKEKVVSSSSMPPVSDAGHLALSSALTYCLRQLTNSCTHFGVEQIWGYLLSSLLGILSGGI